MKISCDIIRDLLPLYNDGVCSGESRTLVEEHLKDCSDCANELEKLREDGSVNMLKAEDNIIGTFRRSTLKKVLFFVVCFVIFPLISVWFAFVYSWFGIVKVFLVTALAMLNTVYIPVTVKKNRNRVITVLSLVTPIVIFFILNLGYIWDYIRFSYYGNLTNIMLFSIPSVAYFILSAGFIPFKIKEDHESPLRYKKAGIRLGVMETLLLVVISVLQEFWSMNEIYDIKFNMFKIVMLSMVFMWIIILLIRFMRTNNFIKASVYSFSAGLMISLYPAIEYLVLYQGSEDKYCFWQANLFSSDRQYTIANVSLIILIIVTAISAVLFVKGKCGNKAIISESKEERKDKE